MSERYEPGKIEEKWQKIWEKEDRFSIKGEGEKKYVLVMFPYPSGRIHMGHVRNYTIGDAVARYLRMKGYDVLHPIGWDAFGLPAENAAIQHGVHPAKWTFENIRYMKSQLKRLGISYDWKRELATCTPEYYKWEQKFFIQMFRKGLAYRAETFVNFCPSCNTVLANEQVIGGRCWRCDTEVEKRKMWGWFLKITAYAEELLKELDGLDWPERVKKMQREWIGKSLGAKFKFPIPDLGEDLEIFTTRPDTVFGVTFMALAPEHPLAEKIATPDRKEEVENFRARVMKMSKEKRGETIEGVFTGRYAKNPFTGEMVPIWIANYVLPDYGTGAIMAVPAHDQRDWEFAQKYNLPIKVVIKPEVEHDFEKGAWEEGGICINSGEFSGLPSEEAKRKITEYAKEKGFGDFAVSYRLRDWGISRQRYWGAPIPIVYCPHCGVVPEKEENLPVKLPENPEDMPKFAQTQCPYCGKEAKRETDTMDTFVESSWYFLAYLSGDEKGINLEKEPFNPRLVKRYMPVVIYIGGIEHAVLHLLYARFFTKVLRDLGYIDFGEPFRKLVTQGMVIKDGAKMSKSKGNVVDPDDVVAQYGADTVRIFILFAAPVEKDLDWSDRGVAGAFRFLKRLWNTTLSLRSKFKLDEVEADENLWKEKKFEGDAGEIQKAWAKTLKGITDDIERWAFNTAIAKMMEFLNFLQDVEKKDSISDDARKVLKSSLLGFFRTLYPFAPHIAEELNEKFSGGFIEKWPDTAGVEGFLKEKVLKIPVQVNGKVRGEITLPPDADEKTALEEALKNPRIAKWVKEVKKVIWVKGRILNIVSS